MNIKSNFYFNIKQKIKIKKKNYLYRNFSNLLYDKKLNIHKYNFVQNNYKEIFFLKNYFFF